MNYKVARVFALVLNSGFANGGQLQGIDAEISNAGYIREDISKNCLVLHPKPGQNVDYNLFTETKFTLGDYHHLFSTSRKPQTHFLGKRPERYSTKLPEHMREKLQGSYSISTNSISSCIIITQRSEQASIRSIESAVESFDLPFAKVAARQRIHYFIDLVK